MLSPRKILKPVLNNKTGNKNTNSPTISYCLQVPNVDKPILWRQTNRPVNWTPPSTLHFND